MTAEDKPQVPQKPQNDFGSPEPKGVNPPVPDNKGVSSAGQASTETSGTSQ